MNNWLEDIELEGELIKLVPLTLEYKDALVEAASDGELWNLWFTSVPSAKTVDAYLNFALKEKEAKRSLPFVVIHKETGEIIGSTRFCNATPEHRRAEIGYTWYAKSYQKSKVNTECKLLMLTHAFESLDAIAIEFKTNWHNHPSRNAILRLGAKQDGVIRNHRLDKDGVIRDTVIFSIICSEWGSVKKALNYKLSQNYI